MEVVLSIPIQASENAQVYTASTMLPPHQPVAPRLFVGQ